MTKFLRTPWPALIVIVTFAIANRTPVPVSFAPLPILIRAARLWRVPAGSGVAA